MTLADILQADDPSGAFALRRRECLARHVIALPIDQRAAWVNEHAAAVKRLEAGRQLKRDVLALLKGEALR